MGTEFAEPEHRPKAVPQHYEGQHEWGQTRKPQPRNAFTHQGPRFDDPMPSSFPSYKRTDGTPEGAERLRQEFLADPELSWLVDRSLKKPTQLELAQIRRAKRDRDARELAAKPSPETNKKAEGAVADIKPTFSERNQRWQLSGSKAGENITVIQDPSRPGWYSIEIEANGKITGQGSIAAKELSKLDLHGGGGKDHIGLLGQMPDGMRVYGDEGDDAIFKTSGNERLPIDGGKGVDRILTADSAGANAKIETPVAMFQRELKENALSALASNRERLDHQQKLYQDPNPKGEQWQQLWKAVSSQRELQRQQANLQQQYELTVREIDTVSVTPDLNTGSMSATAADIQKSPKHKKLLALSEQKKRIEERIALSKQMQLSLAYEFPALSAVTGEAGNTRENNQAIMGRMPQKFDEMRGSIGDLERQIQADPKAALRLDKVVEQTLKAGIVVADVRDPKEVFEVSRWLAHEGFWKGVGTGAGVVGTGALTIASFLFPELGVLRWGAAALGFGTAAAQLPDALIGDRAAQAQRGGGQKLTGMDPDTARSNLVLAGVGVALAGLDVGLQPELIRQVVRLPGVVRATAGLTTAQVQVLMRSVGRLKGQVSDAIIEKMAKAVKQADAGTMVMVDNGDGTLTAIRPLGKMADAMDTTVAARASGKVSVPNPNVSAEVLAKWSKTKNWTEVEPFIGKQAGADLPDGYYYRTLNKGTPEEHIVINRPWGKGSDTETVPLQIGEDVTFQVTTKTTNRISKPKVMERNFEKAYGKRKDGYWIHHLIPDDVVRKSPLAKFARSLGYDLDRASNLEGLANKEQWAKIKDGADVPGKGYTNAVGHWSSHKEYSKQVDNYLDQRYADLKDQFGDLNQAIENPKTKKRLIQEVNQVMTDAENKFRSLIEQGNVPKKDGRISWDNEQTEPTA